MKKTTLWRTPLDLITRYRSALMGAAALFVLFYHCWIPQNFQCWILPELETGLLSVGFIGVEIFLFLSGMGLTYAIEKYENVWMFYGMRLRRVMFPYAVVVLNSVRNAENGFKEFWLLFTGVAYLTRSIQSVLWYVPAAMVLYLAFPLYNRWMRRSKNETAFVLNSIIIWLILSVAFQRFVRTDLWLFINRVPTFLLGVLAGRMRQTRKLEIVSTHWYGIAAALVLGYQLVRLAMKGRMPFMPESVYSLEAAMFGIALALLLSAAFERMQACEGVVGKGMNWAVAALAYVGRFSLELYCIHFYLLELAFKYLEGKITYLQMNMLVIPASILAAWIFFCVHRGFWAAADKVAGTVRTWVKTKS